jgi:cell fate regulator YaaT (PSP1 superfamily)
MNMNVQQKQKQMRKKVMLVQYGRMKLLGLFEHNEAEVPSTHQRVVVKTQKGLELGTVAGRLGCYRAGQLKLSQEQINEYYQTSEVNYSTEVAGRVIRYATAEDISEERHFQKIAADEAEFCRKLVAEMKLPMKVVDAEHILGGERIIFYFMSDGRVDFRELVRRLAHEYQTRIEMRQIGSRDEAKLLGDMESCGQECCCIRFLKALKPVNMRMAKLQKATLDPAKISGYCGRLKCCLRYEDETYLELKKRLPRKNTIVKTAQGKGRVIDGQVLTQLVVVETEAGTRIAIPLDELEIVSVPQRRGGGGDKRSGRRDGARGTKENRKQDNDTDAESDEDEEQ